MDRTLYICILLLTISAGYSLSGFSVKVSNSTFSALTVKDTLKENQSLYSGKVWNNMFRRINGDQFLFANYFLPGTVTSNGKTYKNVLIRYDINSDEIMIPASRDEILQLNKEMIDSFSITFENKVYKFSNIRESSLDRINSIHGYFHVLYKNKSALYIRYKKDILTHITEKSDGAFVETQKIYFVKDNFVHSIASSDDLIEALNANETEIRNWLKANSIKISKKRPESMVPVIKYYESLHQ